MARRALKSLGLALFPLVIFFAVGTLLNQLSRRADARKALEAAAQAGCITNTVPLNVRPLGYSGGEFRRYWRVLGTPHFSDPRGAHAGCVPQGGLSIETPAWIAEERFIQLDLGFPLVYGGALLAALLLAWNALGRPFPRRWAVAPVLALMVSDWIENSAQLRVISYWSANGEGDPPFGWITVASVATIVKCLLIGVCVAALLALLAWYVARAPAAEPGSDAAAAGRPAGLDTARSG